MYAVLGVSGNTGKIVAERLLDAGAPVRVVVRDAAKGEAWRARGAEVAVADLADAAALTEALRGARGLYALLPPSHQSADFLAEQARKAEALATAVRAAGVEHVVLLSSVAAQLPAGTGPIQTLHHAERLLREAAPRTTFVRAAYFLENFGGSLAAAAQGIFPSFLLLDRAMDVVATADIGRVAADALLAGGSGHEVVELASGSPVTPRQIGEIASRQLGRPLQAVQAPLDQVVPTFQQWGLSANMAGLYEEMLRAFTGPEMDPWERAGWFVRGPTTAEQVVRGLLGRGH